MPADLNDYFNKKMEILITITTDKISISKLLNLISRVLEKFSPFVYGVIIIVLFLIIAKPFMVINSGEMGIKSTTGRYDPNPLEPGLHFYTFYTKNNYN